MPLSPLLAKRLGDQGHDAIHVMELRLERAADSEIIAMAKRERRTIVTADLDYPRLLAIAGEDEPSLILFRRGDWSEAEVGQRMRDVLASMSETDIAQSIVVVDRDRIRRRRLPLA